LIENAITETALMTKLPAPSVDLVRDNTSPDVARRIRAQTEASGAACARGGPAAIEQRLFELDREWDVERCLETGAASLSLLGVALGSTLSRKWFLLPAAVAATLLQHTMQGWCPPLPMMRRLGVRTADEINQERFALKALRGDFARLSEAPSALSAAHAFKATLH
jgi:hypothetical protein